MSVTLLSMLTIATKTVASEKVGFHIEFSEIKDKFHRHLVKYIGDCPGEKWSGLAADGDLRFISYEIKPSKELKVSLINKRTGKKITRDYKKLKQGSNDFNLRQLGNEDGEHDIEYQIYHKKTQETINSGNFAYIVTSSEEIQQRNAEWKIELFCAEDTNKKVRDCDVVGKRETKYCNGINTRETRNRGIINLDKKIVEID